jgi:hypothetical protein
MQFYMHVEATGLTQDHLPLTHPFQPHLLRFCGIVFDEAGHQVDQLFTLVKPISPMLVSWEASKYETALVERAKFEGLDPSEVLHWFNSYDREAGRLANDNALSDLKVMRILSARLNRRLESSQSPLTPDGISLPRKRNLKYNIEIRLPKPNLNANWRASVATQRSGNHSFYRRKFELLTLREIQNLNAKFNFHNRYKH